MTTMSPEQVMTPDSLEIFEFEIACEISEMRSQGADVPPCQGEAARWVAWRANCCPRSPQYRLICDRCKTTYQAWQAKNAYIYCGSCGEETGGFISFVPLKGSS